MSCWRRRRSCWSSVPDCKLLAKPQVLESYLRVSEGDLHSGNLNVGKMDPKAVCNVHVVRQPKASSAMLIDTVDDAVGALTPAHSDGFAELAYR